MVGQPVFYDVSGENAEDDVAIELWFASDEIADDVVADHELVDGVGLHVLAVEVLTRLRRPHAL